MIFCYVDQLIPLIVKPAGKLYFSSPSDAFNACVTVSIVAALVVASPYILYQLWAFIGVALKERERRFIFIYGPLSVVFFLSGVAFAFWVAVPMSYRFLMGFASSYMVPLVTVDNYFKFLGQMLLGFGIAFELPLIMAFFAAIGIATPEFLRQKRRHAILTIVIISAILTPPDVGSQLTMAVPLIVLYELGIVMVKIFQKHKTL